MSISSSNATHNDRGDRGIAMALALTVGAIGHAIKGGAGAAADDKNAAEANTPACRRRADELSVNTGIEC